MNRCEFLDNEDCILFSEEVNDLDEILKQGVSLSTTSGQQLITGGMIKFADCDVKFKYSFKIRMRLIRNFFNCHDSSLLKGMQLYSATRSGNWRRGQVDIDTVGNEIWIEFSTNVGGFFNCDVPTKKSGISDKRSSIKFVAPKHKKIKRIFIGTECCNNPVIYGGGSVDYYAKRRKARIYLGSCFDREELKVSAVYYGAKQPNLVK